MQPGRSSMVRKRVAEQAVGRIFPRTVRQACASLVAETQRLE